MTNTELMQSIKTKWGDLLTSAAATSHVPVSFLAALVANESGGNPDAKRFEKNVLASLWEVLLGRKAAFGSIGAQDLVQFIGDIPGRSTLTSGEPLPPYALVRLDQLATSWGLTQIMGYEVLDGSIGTHGLIASIQQPAGSLAATLRMLAQFAQRNGLDLATNFSELFDCWNTGRPHAPTFDPQYIPNGLARMKEYEALP